MQTVDTAGRAFITQEEGEVLHAYRCAAGVLTIGVGHTGPDVHEGMTISQQQSQALLSKDLARFEDSVRTAVRVPLDQHQFNALVSFNFNLGEGALAKSSLLKWVNGGHYSVTDITKAFQLWNKVNGRPNAKIKTRRGREAALFFKE